MSASPIARQITSLSQSIPSKRIMITDASQLPDVYSSTPGGTLYSTTPGGTRIVYERAFMMNLRNSPISQTPPRNLPSSLLRGSKDHPPSPPHCIPSPIINTPTIDEQPEEQFAMDI